MRRQGGIRIEVNGWGEPNMGPEGQSWSLFRVRDGFFAAEFGLNQAQESAPKLFYRPKTVLAPREETAFPLLSKYDSSC